MVAVGHVVDLTADCRGGALWNEEHIKAVAAQQADIVGYLRAVAGGIAVEREPADPEPAVLVERDPHGIDLPGEHRADRGLVDRPVRDPGVVIRAATLEHRSVDAAQLDVLPRPIHEAVVLHPQRRRAA